MRIETHLTRCVRRLTRWTALAATAVGVLGVALLVPSVAGAAVADLPRLPADRATTSGNVESGATLKLHRSSVQEISSSKDVFAKESAVGGTSSMIAAAADVPLDSVGTWFWNGGYVIVGGYVVNNTASSLGPVMVDYTMRNSAGLIVDSGTTIVATYNLAPGQTAFFWIASELPAYEGQNMSVQVSTRGVQPSTFPTAVNLTLVSRVMSTSDGMRTYTCTFRNDSPNTVEQPLVGGVEENYDNVYDTLFAFEKNVQIPAGGEWSTEVYGLVPDVTPTGVQTYCQALPVAAPTPMPVWRFYNLRAGVHFYTASEAEKNNVINTLGGVYRFEGPSYTINLSNPNNTLPVYRFFNLKQGVHFYTASEEEKNTVINTLGGTYRFEGPSYNVSRTSVNAFPVYRFYNLKQGVHFYTSSEVEKNNVINTLGAVYRFEGISYWVGK